MAGCSLPEPTFVLVDIAEVSTSIKMDKKQNNKEPHFYSLLRKSKVCPTLLPLLDKGFVKILGRAFLLFR
jgi:hypothetical protein